ncbi:unnamed protein product [Owenia fusiformis]|uniref:Transmembrane protein 208 n=1 Tax=Owenia fusiformis TaxID=6347 RepID=A0A8J1UU80_OWEFU|nr:unnamed protein product [Owenia fusiformis]
MPPKGKVATKGQKQIVEENKETLRFYKTVIAAVNVIYLLVNFFLFWDSFRTWNWVITIFVSLVYFGSYYFMGTMARATYSPDGGTLYDGGIDLNMESGMAEHAKDTILLCAIVQILTIISNYFWLGLLIIPGRAFYLLWVNILAPWFFAEPPPEMDDKKQKKMERKMKRRQ